MNEYIKAALMPHVEVLAGCRCFSKFRTSAEFTKPVRYRLLEVPHIEVLAGCWRIINF
jgi:hypothetical protein